MGLLGQLPIAPRIFDPRLMQRGIAREPQDLVDTAARHHVAAEKKSDDIFGIT
jgi:hypothetical protein